VNRVRLGRVDPPQRRGKGAHPLGRVDQAQGHAQRITPDIEVGRSLGGITHADGHLDDGQAGRERANDDLGLERETLTGDVERVGRRHGVAA
jgi:hypothetical protein